MRNRWQHWLSHPKTLHWFSTILLFIFIWWAASTYLPVAAVEAKYQYQRILTGVFHVRDMRSLFVPDFEKMLDWRGRSEHRQYGIMIPALFLDEPVVFNVDPNDKNAYQLALKQGIAHASGTAFPDNPGLGYYFAHSSNPDVKNQYNAVFYLLGKLALNDEVFIWHEGQRYEYRVSRADITDPGDVSFLNQEYPAETIVLQTCWPPGTTAKRLLVFAERR